MGVEKMNLSVVIITRNEQNNIKSCVESVLSEVVTCCAQWEIIISDSDSADCTVQSAMCYPVRIIEVRGTHLSAALGRHVGLMHSNYPYVLFLDGDMELRKGFIEKAYSYLEQDRGVAGVVGQRDDIIYDNGHIVGHIENVYDIQEIGECRHFGGAFLARSDVVRKVGSYDIHMFSNEEPELHSRLMMAGYKVLEIPEPMVVHHDGRGKINRKSRISTIFNKRYLGLGRGLRVSLIHNSSRWYLKRTIEFVFPITIDIVSILIVCFLWSLGSAMTITLIGLQISNLLFCYLIGKLKRFLQSKVLLPYFILGALIPLPNIEYTVKQVKAVTDR
jgi:glycosyltransferase involved in cell wall biosynthesis